MRFILLAFALLPLASWAQKPVSLYQYQPGSYVLSDAPGVRHTGTVRMRTSAVIDVQAEDGKKARLDVNQVKSFRLGQRQFVATHQTIGKEFVKRIDCFVEQRDSGQVVFGAAIIDGYRDDFTLLLLKHAQDPDYTPVETGTMGKNSSFKQSVRPFLATRADLLAQLENNDITWGNLGQAIHALNTGQPFVKPKR